MQQNTPQQFTAEDSWDLIYDLLKERAVAQLNQVDGLDNKANNILVAASALLGAGLVLEVALLTLPIHALTLNFTHTLLCLTALLLAYLFTMLTAIWGGFWVRSFQLIPEPEPFVQQYLSRPVTETKGDVIATQVNVYKTNRKAIKPKVCAIRLASILFCAEVFALIALLLFQIF